MRKENIINKLKEIRYKYEQEGVAILGIFGSYATNKANKNSDIDILIETTPKFLKRYKGFRSFSRLDEIKKELKHYFDKEIDFIDKTGLKQHNNTYILEHTLYVS